MRNVSIFVLFVGSLASFFHAQSASGVVMKEYGGLKTQDLEVVEHFPVKDSSFSVLSNAKKEVAAKGKIAWVLARCSEVSNKLIQRIPELPRLPVVSVPRKLAATIDRLPDWDRIVPTMPELPKVTLPVWLHKVFAKVPSAQEISEKVPPFPTLPKISFEFLDRDRLSKRVSKVWNKTLSPNNRRAIVALVVGAVCAASGIPLVAYMLRKSKSPEKKENKPSQVGGADDDNGAAQSNDLCVGGLRNLYVRNKTGKLRQQLMRPKMLLLQKVRKKRSIRSGWEAEEGSSEINAKFQRKKKRKKGGISIRDFWITRRVEKPAGSYSMPPRGVDVGTSPVPIRQTDGASQVSPQPRGVDIGTSPMPQGFPTPQPQVASEAQGKGSSPRFNVFGRPARRGNGFGAVRVSKEEVVSQEDDSKTVENGGSRPVPPPAPFSHEALGDSDKENWKNGSVRGHGTTGAINDSHAGSKTPQKGGCLSACFRRRQGASSHLDKGGGSSREQSVATALGPLTGRGNTPGKAPVYGWPI